MFPRSGSYSCIATLEVVEVENTSQCEEFAQLAIQYNFLIDVLLQYGVLPSFPLLKHFLHGHSNRLQVRATPKVSAPAVCKITSGGTIQIICTIMPAHIVLLPIFKPT